MPATAATLPMAAAELRRRLEALIQATAGLEAEVEVSHPGLPRRYYTLTGAGRRTLAEDARRLKRVAAIAEKRIGLARGRS